MTVGWEIGGEGSANVSLGQNGIPSSSDPTTLEHLRNNVVDNYDTPRTRVTVSLVMSATHTYIYTCGRACVRSFMHERFALRYRFDTPVGGLTRRVKAYGDRKN